MVTKIVLATNNQHKLKEYTEILAPLGFKVLSYKDVLKDEVEVEETGKTFADNSKLKAEFIFKKTGLMTIADDSGFCINKLNDFPGVKSARFVEEMGGMDKAIEDLYKRVGQKFAAAKFVCAIALCSEFDKTKVFEGVCNGVAVYPSRGETGFGYDPIFVPNGYGQTFAEMQPEEKNAISHRAVAVEKLLKFFEKMKEDEKKKKLDMAKKQVKIIDEKAVVDTVSADINLDKMEVATSVAGAAVKEDIVVDAENKKSFKGSSKKEKAVVNAENKAEQVEALEDVFNVDVDYKFEKSE